MALGDINCGQAITPLSRGPSVQPLPARSRAPAGPPTSSSPAGALRPGDPAPNLLRQPIRPTCFEVQTSENSNWASHPQSPSIKIHKVNDHDHGLRAWAARKSSRRSKSAEASSGSSPVHRAAASRSTADRIGALEQRGNGIGSCDNGSAEANGAPTSLAFRRLLRNRYCNCLQTNPRARRDTICQNNTLAPQTQ